MAEAKIVRARARRLVVEPKRCHACQSCMVACSLVHEGRVVPSQARVQIVFDPFHGQQLIHYCRQCRNAPCAQACPQEAIVYRAEAGYWAIDEARCTGCGACVEACPFQAIIVSPTSGKALKCDTCVGEPACAASCPTGAITWPAEDKAS